MTNTIEKRKGYFVSCPPLMESPCLHQLSQISAIEDEALDFRGEDTQYSTHGLHTYLAAMVPRLARKLIDTYVPKGGLVLDPFCGGGAVLVEALLTGRQARGHDINDLALLVAEAKTTHIPKEQIEPTGKLILEKAKAYTGSIITFDKTENVAFWFKPYMFSPLSALRHSIDELPSSAVKTLFRVVFSATVRDVSLTYRNEIRLRRMTEKEQEGFNPDVFSKFEDRMKQAADRVPSLPTGCKAEVGKLDVRNLRQSRYKDIADAIVCSPPYGDERNGVPYTQFAKNMLYWLGYSQEQLKESKNHSLGWIKNYNVIPYSPALLEALAKIYHNETAFREAVCFYADYFTALNGMANAVRDRIVIVIGQRVLQNTIFDNGRITMELMADIGIPTEHIFLRRLPSKRLPKMREFGAAINRETILVFKK